MQAGKEFETVAEVKAGHVGWWGDGRGHGNNEAHSAARSVSYRRLSLLEA